MIEQKLKQIGLSDKEIGIYLLSLRLGSQPASNIARHTKINRATVYDVFAGLIEKGLANKLDRAGVTCFEVLPPENLLRFLEQEKQAFIHEKDQQKQEISTIIPFLQSIELAPSSKPKIKFFEGKKGLKEAYAVTLKSKTPIRAYANVSEMHECLPDFFPSYYQRRANAGIFIRAIMPDNPGAHERLKQDEAEAREVKLIDEKKFGFSPEVNIFDDTVIYFSWKERMAVLVESSEISHFHRQMFDLMWTLLD